MPDKIRGIKYIKRPNDSGWLKVISVSNQKAIYIFVKVQKLLFINELKERVILLLMMVIVSSWVRKHGYQQKMKNT